MSGTIEMRSQDQAALSLHAGESVLIPPSTAHNALDSAQAPALVLPLPRRGGRTVGHVPSVTPWDAAAGRPRIAREVIGRRSPGDPLPVARRP